jgi:hypothetical protein
MFLNRKQGNETDTGVPQALRFVLAAIAIAFTAAVVGATITTVRQLDQQTLNSPDRLPDGKKLMKYPS